MEPVTIGAATLRPIDPPPDFRARLRHQAVLGSSGAAVAREELTVSVLDVAVCGGVRVRVDCGPELAPRSRRAATLLAYLALAPRFGATRERLADLLWSRREPEQARASLRQCLLELRSLAATGAWLAADRSRVALTAERIAVDLLEIVAIVASGAPVAEAIAAVRRAPPDAVLAGMAEGEELEQWVLEARAAFERDLVRAIADRLSRLAGTGEHGASRELADVYLDGRPDSEEIAVAAMEAEVALGEESAALRRFERLKAMLARELGCAPGRAATDLRDAIRAGTARRQSASPAPSPASPVRAIAEQLGEADGPPLLFVPETTVRDGAGRDGRAVALREEVLAGLARFRDVRLSSRRAPTLPSELSPAEAERAYTLAMTLWDEGGAARLTARVVRVSDEAVIWAETLDLARTGTGGGIATVVRRVTGAVLPAVADHFFRQLRAHAGGPYDRYLLARHRSIHGRSFDEVAAAGEELARIVAEQPDFAPAYAPLVRLLNTDHGYSGLGLSGRAERARALDLARTALTLDPQDAHNHSVLGFCHLWHDQPVLARKRLERALGLNPFNLVRIYEVATGFVYLGDFDDARALLAASNDVAPGDNDAYHEDVARLAIAEGDAQGALTELDLVTRPIVKTRLYAAMAATRAGRAGATDEVAAWRADVVARWRGAAAPDRDTLVAWIGFHHPFLPEIKERFMAWVTETLPPERG